MCPRYCEIFCIGTSACAIQTAQVWRSVCGLNGIPERADSRWIAFLTEATGLPPYST